MNSKSNYKPPLPCQTKDGTRRCYSIYCNENEFEEGRLETKISKAKIQDEIKSKIYKPDQVFKNGNNMLEELIRLKRSNS